MINLENEISNCLNKHASKIHPSADLKNNVFAKLQKNKHMLLHNEKHKHSYRKIFIDLSEVLVVALIIFAIPTYIIYHKNFTDKNHFSSSLQQSTDNAMHQNSNINIKTANDKNNIQSNEIKKNNLQGHILIISNPKKIVLGYNNANLQDFKTTSELAKENNAVCAINAGFFKTPQHEDNINSQKVPAGFIIHEGKVVYKDKSDDEKESMVGFENSGLLIVGNYSINEIKNMQIKEAISDTIPLISNGKVVNSMDGFSPRTAIGQKADGSVIFLTIDGRITASSPGASIKNVTDILLDAGAINAALLDGGSSTTMVLNGNVINHPCYKDGERPVASAFLTLK